MKRNNVSSITVKPRDKEPGFFQVSLNMFLYMLWFNFILGLIFIFLCFKFSIMHYHTQKQRKIKIKPRIKLNYNINMVVRSEAEKVLPGIDLKTFDAPGQSFTTRARETHRKD